MRRKDDRDANGGSEDGRSAPRIVSRCGEDCRACGRAAACATFMKHSARATERLRAGSSEGRRT